MVCCFKNSRMLSPLILVLTHTHTHTHTPRIVFVLAAPISYFAGLFYYTIKNFGTNFCATQGQCLRCLNCRLAHEPPRWRKSWTFSLHGFAILVGVSGLAFGIAFGLETKTVFEFLFFYAVFNTYVHTVTFLYYPSDLDADGVSMSDMERLAEQSDEDDGEATGQDGYDGASI